MTYETFTSNGSLIVLRKSEDGTKERKATFKANGSATVCVWSVSCNRWVVTSHGKSGLRDAKKMLEEAEASFA